MVEEKDILPGTILRYDIDGQGARRALFLRPVAGPARPHDSITLSHATVMTVIQKQLDGMFDIWVYVLASSVDGSPKAGWVWFELRRDLRHMAEVV